LTSFWDKHQRRIIVADTERRGTLEAQTELWGWCDMRQRGHIRTYANGWLSGLLNPPNDKRGRRHGMVYSAKTVIDDVERKERAEFEKEAREAMGTARDRKAKAKPDEGGTLTELAEYVSGAWDTGGSIYCATKTWFGSGLSDAFERIAAKEKLSKPARQAAERDLLATMPPCRNCGCRPAKRVA
jgi:hypothetical protein